MKRIILVAMMILVGGLTAPAGVNEKDDSPASINFDERPFTGELILTAFWVKHTDNIELIQRAIHNEFGIPSTIIMALVRHESQFNENAIGRNPFSSDYGLFQLNSNSYKEYSPEDLLYPTTNIDLGIKHLAKELNRFEWDIELALKAYNAGAYRVRRGEEPESTKRYSKAVLNNIEKFENELQEFLKGF